MSEWALIKDGHIVNVVMTPKSQAEVQESYPDFEVKDLYSLEAAVLEGYPYWRERP